MTPRTTGAVLTTVALLAATGWQLHTRTMRRVLSGERAAARLTDGALYRDRLALEARLAEATARQSPDRSAEAAVLAAADAALTEALATYVSRTDPQEGGTQ